MTNELRKSIGGVTGTFIALSTILGSGMMILPGTSYRDLGTAAWLPWLIAALSVVPLLYCYAWLGRHHPSASGVAHQSEIALGARVGRTSGLLATFALVAGIPATAVTGGRYVAEFSGVGSLVWLVPVIVLGGATLVALLGANVSGRVQVGLILALFALILGASLTALGTYGAPAPRVELPEWGVLGSVLTAVFVAFTGWETVSFTFEEHRRADLIPRIFAASYVVVVALYALLLLSLFAVAEPGDEGLSSGPLLILAERALGEVGRPVTLVLVLACITANVCASVLALSRLVFGLSRSGYLPTVLSSVREADGNPVRSVVAVGGALTVIALLSSLDVFDFTVLFVLSGGAYFVLYGVGVAAFARLARGRKAFVISVVSAVTVLVVTLLAGPSMWACWALFGVLWLGAVVLTRRRSAHRSNVDAPS